MPEIKARFIKNIFLLSVFLFLSSFDAKSQNVFYIGGPDLQINKDSSLFFLWDTTNCGIRITQMNLPDLVEIHYAFVKIDRKTDTEPKAVYKYICVSDEKNETFWEKDKANEKPVYIIKSTYFKMKLCKIPRIIAIPIIELEVK
jgi:hypothetical protein